MVVLKSREVTYWPAEVVLAAIILLADLRLIADTGATFVRGLRTIFPLLLFSPLYTGTGLVSRGLRQWVLSRPLERWEGALFGGQPSMYLAEKLPSLALSETLHAAYVSYYLLVAALPLALLLAGREEDTARTVLALCLCFALCNLFYIWLPVASPFFIYPPIGPPFSDGFFYQLAHGISNRGGVLGGAFPSSHAALTGVNLLMAFRFQRKLFWWTLAPSALLLVATVYCRYHYALDIVAGVALAAGVAFAVSSLWPKTARTSAQQGGG
jgi:membrane-associated phospholipid phosphatase